MEFFTATNATQLAIAVFSGGTFGALATFVIRWRGQGFDQEGSIRDHYAKEVERLTRKLDDQSSQFRQDLQAIEDKYRQLLDDSEKRHEECQKDRDALRKRVMELEDEWRGMLRIVTQASIDKVLHIPGLSDDMPEDMRDMAARVEQIIKDTGGTRV